MQTNKFIGDEKAANGSWTSRVLAGYAARLEIAVQPSQHPLSLRIVDDFQMNLCWILAINQTRSRRKWTTR